MNTITYASGKRVEFPKYEKFLDTKKVLKEADVDYVSYYDRVGDTHICQWIHSPGVVKVCGTTQVIDSGLSHREINNIVAEMVKEERWDEFKGWSL